jgi:hypothetical protein
MEQLHASDTVAALTEVTRQLVEGAFGEELSIYQAGTNNAGDLVLLISMPELQFDWLIKRAAAKVAKDLACDFGTTWRGDSYILGFSRRTKKRRRRLSEPAPQTPSGD